MLELKDISLQLDNPPDNQMLLAEVSVRFPTNGHFAAVLGPSGCGKSTFLKVVAGLREHTLGHIIWEGRDLVDEGDLAAHEIGYVPQFSIAYDLLTVWESVEGALRLRVSLSPEERATRLEQILKEVGLDGIAERRVQVLSGGQKRRLALALEMVSSPRLLLCDEVTSGLDPNAEDEIAHLLHELSRREKRIVLSVTHSLRHLSLCDSVLVLFQGHVAYHGAPEFLFHYFGVDKQDELFPRLVKRKPEEWHRSWLKHRDLYYEQSGLTGDGAAKAHAVAELPVEAAPAPAEEKDEARLTELFNKLEPADDLEAKPAAAAPSAEAAEPTVATEKKAEEPAREPRQKAESETLTPSPVTQFLVLLNRRWKLFFRDRGQLALQLALLFGFPCLVVIFALDGLPTMKNLTGTGNWIQQIQNDINQRADLMHAGSLVSGLIMFQVILLALMGSNNAAREIAGERLIFEKEKFAGLDPLAYVLSKAVFLSALVVAQSVWMAVFVNWVVRFPGSLIEQILLLLLVNAALTAVSLGISALMRSPEQASLVSVYLVGFQLPLSGAVLAMPKALGYLTRPFIASYWGWSGFIQTLRDTRFYDAVLQVTQTGLSAEMLCLGVLLSHVVVGMFLAYTGSRSARWE